VLLLDGEKIRGRLLDVTEQDFTIRLGETETQFAFNEVAAVRKLGMKTAHKVLIGTGIVLGIILGLTAIAYATYDP
jgi:hypothetical protein